MSLKLTIEDENDLLAHRRQMETAPFAAEVSLKPT